MFNLKWLFFTLGITVKKDDPPISRRKLIRSLAIGSLGVAALASLKLPELPKAYGAPGNNRELGRNYLSFVDAQLVDAQSSMEPEIMVQKLDGTVGSPDYGDLSRRNEQYGASYIIFLDGPTYKAKNGSNGHIDYHSSDPGAVVQSCITTLGTSPFVIILAPNINFAYTWTVPAFNRNATGWQKIIGYGATITLAAGAPRAFDFNKVADGDKFRNISLEGFTVDGNNLTDATTQHIILGTIANGNQMSKVSFDQIRIRDINTKNLSVTSGQPRFNVWLMALWEVGYPPSSITNILIENLNMQGGNEGVAVGAEGTTETNANVFIDNVCIHRCTHSMLAVPTSYFAANHFQIGNSAYGGRCHIADCYGEYSADDGVEINAMTHALVENCLMRDTWSEGYLLVNYNLPLKSSGVQGVEEQVIVFRDCRDRRIELSASDPAHHGFGITSFSNEPLGTVVLDACEYYGTTSNFQRGDAISVITSYGLTKLIISKFKCELDGIIASSGTVTLNPIYVGPTGSTAYVSMNDIEIIGTGNKAAGTFLGWMVDLEGTMVIEIDNVKMDVYITNGDDYAMSGIMIGNNASSTIQGNISRLHIARLGADAYTYGIFIQGTSSLTIPISININDCNLSVCAQGIKFPDLTNVANVWLGRGNVFHAPYGVLANAFDTTNNHVGFGVYVVGGSTHPNSGEQVTAVNTDLLITSSGGTVTSIVTSDPNGKQETSWGTTCQGVLLARGHQIKFVYTVAPTIVVSMIGS
jgi:hypothetical protein